MTEKRNSKKYWHYPVGKFMSFNEFTADIFQKKRLFLNSPVNFNDPYEGQNTKMPFLEYDALITCFTGLGNEKGICSNTLFNPLMWSHYSDFNKGFCLVFDPLIAGLHAVKYTNTRVEDYNYTKTLLHKGKQWSHENEQRFISDKAGNVLGKVEYDNGNYFLKFYPDDLKAIVFGSKTPPEVKSKIFDYLSYFVMTNDEGERGIKSLCIKQLQLSHNSYNLECQETLIFSPIKPKDGGRIKWTMLPYIKGLKDEKGSIEDIMRICPNNKPKSRPETPHRMKYDD